MTRLQPELVTMTEGWASVRDHYAFDCSCGWSHSITRMEIITDPQAMEMARLAAAGHTKEAHNG